MINKVVISPAEQYAEGHWKVELFYDDGAHKEFKVSQEEHVWVQTLLKTIQDGLKN